MARIHSKEINDAEIQAEIAELREAVELEKLMKQLTILDLFKPQLLTRTFCAAGAQVWRFVGFFMSFFCFVLTLCFR